VTKILLENASNESILVEVNEDVTVDNPKIHIKIGG
jgi:hypothetical protein